MELSEESKICISCQECCKWVTFTLAYYNVFQEEQFEKFYAARGFKVLKHHDCVEVMIPTVCPKLDKKRGCTIWKKRPKLCAKYDGRNDPLMADKCQLPERRKKKRPERSRM